MKDLKKLKEIYKMLTKALRGIEDIGALSDYDLDCEVEEIYKAIDDAHTDVYGLIEVEKNKQWKTIIFL